MIKEVKNIVKRVPFGMGRVNFYVINMYYTILYCEKFSIL